MGKRPRMCISVLSRLMNEKRGIAVFAGTLTDDNRFNRQICKKIKVCALRYTKTAMAKILSSGGQCLTFDQLALLAPKGSNCKLFRGRKNGSSPAKRSNVLHGKGGIAPRIRSSCRKHE